MKYFLRYFLAILILISFQKLSSQNYLSGTDVDTPKREFRAAWVATSRQLDWPKTTDPELGEQLLRNIIRRSKDLGMNAVVFQVVARGDAMYNSERLPWSPWLTGTPGKDPGWDPLAVAISESHKLGMELHAWVNAFLVAAEHTPRSAESDPSHIAYAEPEWVVNNHWLNPGIPDARRWQIENVIELIENYDVDAIHFDFIRYPEGGLPGITDYLTREEYDPDGLSNLNDWRRNNINEFVRDAYTEIKSRKPWIKVGSAVIGHHRWFAGAWSALWGYSSVFQDSRLWLEEGVHDYLAPMTYWDIGHSVDVPPFEFVVRDWVKERLDRHIYAGTGIYKSWVFNELPAQIDTVRAAEGQGQVHFHYDVLNQSPAPFGNRYDNLSLIPVMEWLGGDPPPPPVALRYERIPSTGTAQFRWEDGSHNGKSKRYVLYQFPHNTITDYDLDNPENILYVTGEKTFTASPSGRDGNYYAVTALDRNNNESAISEVFELVPPAVPVLSYPPDTADDLSDSVMIGWYYSEYAGGFDIEVSVDPSFSGDLFLNETNVPDTMLILTGLEGQQEYYWRVRAGNPAGSSDFSDPHSFRTGFPGNPRLLFPADRSRELPLEVTFEWKQTPSAKSYRFQLATSMVFHPGSVIVDTVGIADTTLTALNLEGNKVHFWRVCASNEYGSGAWSDVRGFRTMVPTSIDDTGDLPKEYAISQNYPNPFNPVTRIRYQLPVASPVQIHVYDVLGREISVLIDDVKPAGIHTVDFNAGNLPTGLYIYRITAGDFIALNQMMYLK